MCGIAIGIRTASRRSASILRRTYALALLNVSIPGTGYRRGRNIRKLARLGSGTSGSLGNSSGIICKPFFLFRPSGLLLLCNSNRGSNVANVFEHKDWVLLRILEFLE